MGDQRWISGSMSLLLASGVAMATQWLPFDPVLYIQFSAICVAYKSISFLKQIQATVLQLYYVKSYIFHLLSAVFAMLSQS